MLTEAWLPESLAAGIDRQALEEKALYQLLIDQGVAFGRLVQEFSAITASPQQARLLATNIGQPLLRLGRLLYDSDKRPVQYLIVTLISERSRVLMDMPIDPLEKLMGGGIFHDTQGRQITPSPAREVCAGLRRYAGAAP